VSIFLLAFLAIVEFTNFFYVKLTVQHALEAAGRYMVTGQANVPDPDNPDENLPRCEAIERVFQNLLLGTGAGLQSLTTQVVVDEPPANTDCGGPNDTVMVTAVFQKPFFSGVFRMFDPLFPTSITFSASTTWRNEGYTS
jgi:Flp pilus assembly protein TadG